MNCTSIMKLSQSCPTMFTAAEDGECGLKCLDSRLESLRFAKHRFLAPSSTVKSVFSADLFVFELLLLQAHWQ